ncbi:HIT family protein [Azospirillum soli]|uniref:HIT family protein n=1 Tax=Azospirillum soli TaxID=1304799 RepID=UPI001AEA0D7E|nr:HIT family protein [Azospirillum soli]MBP2313865.1 histidine triad (HIT) family protein [Azospirillum soli]
MSETTIFSRLIAGELPCAKVYEDEQTFAFMDAGQVNPGHVLVALKRPAPTILDVSEDEAAALFRTVHRVAKAVQAAFEPEGITLLQANKAAGWQTVPHIHIHVVPRYEGDGADLVWPRNNPPMDELKALGARIVVA